MKVALVGCGYVADFYVRTLGGHPRLGLAGVYDRRPERALALASTHGLRTYPSLEAVLSDREVDIVANLTNPSSHFEVSRAALLAGKHVYSEKPLALGLDRARELVELARSNGLRLAGAPCGVLGEAAQTAWRALRQGRLGKVRLAYAELDDGPIHLMDYQSWRSDSGAPWPYRDEFETGCTLEHAGYYVSWLVAFFGSATRVTAFACTLVSDKGTPLYAPRPDFTVGCIEFDSGTVARITSGIYAPHDHRLRLFGDEGVMEVRDCWDYGSRVDVLRRTKLGLRAERHPRLAALLGLGPRRLGLVRRPPFRLRSRGANQMDFARGLLELAESVGEGRPCRLSAEFSLHVNEIVLALQEAGPGAGPRTLTTAAPAMAPMPWAS